MFREAAAKGMHAITAGPVGFSGIWIVFDPDGMTYDEYFDLSDDMSPYEKLAAFAVGVAPKATHRSYMDMRYVDMNARVGPSSSVGCHIAAGAMACEAVKILLRKGRVKVAPWYHQFDPFVNRCVIRRIRRGNRNWLQRIKRRYLVKLLRQQGS